MVSTVINLKQIKFDDSVSPLFKGDELELSSKNFIFAKNGSGKSTLSKWIYSQKQSEYEVHVFDGFESLIGENENLDAFSLAVGAGDKEAEIKELEKKILKTEQNLSLIQKQLDKRSSDGEEPTLFDDFQEKDKLYEKQYKKLDSFYKKSARTISLKRDPIIMVILTHNVHFYLNVQPHGNFKDDKGRTKYDKNNFYRIDHHEFIKITTEKEDLKTSYEALWIELKDLYECGHKLSMLNTMRRIIETFVKFNSLKQDRFYQGNEQYLKLFNVNSHAIDDLSATQYTETTDEMRNLFFQIFKDNDYEDHFKNYWEFKTDW